MNLDPADFPDLETIEVTIVEETSDGKRYVTVFGSLSDIPALLPASVGTDENKLANALDLHDVVREAYSQNHGSP